MDAQSSEVKKLTTLLKVSQALSGTLNLKAAPHREPDVLERDHGMIRSAVTLLNKVKNYGIDRSRFR
jgi:Nif-specific regulatory protein